MRVVHRRNKEEDREELLRACHLRIGIWEHGGCGEIGGWSGGSRERKGRRIGITVVISSEECLVE
jgi:hypothetical protein